VRYVGEERRGEDSKCAYRMLVGKPEGKKSLGRSGHRCEDNIKVYLKEIRWNDAEWIDLAQDRGRGENHHLGEQVNKVKYYTAILNKYVTKI
jgi:hypothetical protein